MKIKKGYFQEIDERFTLRIATEDKDELERILELNLKVHGGTIKKYIERLYLKHPKKNEILWFYVENNYSNQIISGFTLMPLEWEAEGMVLPICEMGLVSTLEEYRGKGFIAKMNELYEKVMAERGYIFSIIRGIPYYYRRFNYEFAIPLDERITFSPEKVPTEELSNLSVRKANSNDILFIKSNYNKFHEKFYFNMKFQPDCFIFRFLNDDFDDNMLSTFILEEAGHSVAYFSLGMSYDNKAFTINVAQLTEEQMIKILQYIKKSYEKMGGVNLEFHVKYDSEFGRFIIHLGGVAHQSYGWQIRIPILKLFFETIKKIIEKRIEHSKFQGLSKKVVISNYQENIELNFINGKITTIQSVSGYPDLEKCDVAIPGTMLIKLILSDKTLDEINYIIDDAFWNPSSRLLIDTIFPKKMSYPDTYY